MTKRRLIDYEKATKMLAKGTPVRAVAEHFGVTTQAIYWAIGEGYIQRPQVTA